jgi:hypothetical protein
LIHAAQGIEQENGEHMLRLGNETNLGRANRRLNLVGKANLGADTGTETRKKWRRQNSIEKRAAHEELGLHTGSALQENEPAQMKRRRVLRFVSNTERMQKSNFLLNSNKIPTITEVTALSPSFELKSKN